MNDGEVEKFKFLDKLIKLPNKNKKSQISVLCESVMSVSSSKLRLKNAYTTGYDAYFYNGEIVLAKPHHPLVAFQNKHHSLMKSLKQTDHENLNQFVGLCINAPNHTLSIWKYNSRNSLKDVLISGPPTSDAFFKFSLMNDLINGLDAIHKASCLKIHGKLSSTCCFINERWQLKINDYGLIPIGLTEDKVNSDYLWTAPELLRSGEQGSKEGDIYSFAIICSEIATEQTAWNGLNDDKAVEEIIYNVKRGRLPLKRPKLEVNTRDFSPLILQLIEECWSEHPEDRPTTETIKKLFRSVKLSNLKSQIRVKISQKGGVSDLFLFHEFVFLRKPGFV